MSDRALVVGTLVILGAAFAGAGFLYYRAEGEAPDRPPLPPPASKPAAAAPEPPRVRPFEPVQLMEFPYKAVTEVPALPAGDPAVEVDDGESVVGVVVGGAARAYPLGMIGLPEAEVLNDAVGGRRVVVTWCSRCRDAVAFDPTVDGRALTFFIPGLVWRSNMVLRDRETGSLWSQALGRAEEGLLKGKTLTRLPAVVTDWASWRAAHPDTTVAALRRQTVEPPQKEDYTGERGDRYVIGLVPAGAGSDAVAWPFAALKSHPVVNDEAGGRPVLVAFDTSSGTARAYARTLEGRALTFTADGRTLRDAETKTAWDPATGRALSGELAGRALEPLPAFVILREAWREFYPAAREWSPR